VGIRVRKMVAVGHLVHKYDEIICSIHQGGHPASHHDPKLKLIPLITKESTHPHW